MKALLALLLGVSVFSATAQTYPARSVRMLVGFPPGGGTDIMARVLAPQLQQQLGQPFVVENRPGATTNIELIDAQRGARDAETAVAQAEDRVRQARLDLLVALGRFPQ